ncbi:MAG: 3-hydroxyacyl-CoA dehydrogenase [Lautropia sp.]
MKTAIRSPAPPRLGVLETAVVGAGVMGQGIAQLFAQHGMRVRLHDAAPGAAAKAIARIGDVWRSLEQKGRLDPETRSASVARLVAVDSLEALHDADLVVEAIVERLDVKRELFQRLEAIVGPDAILASNTSSLSITAIAAGALRPERIAGLHFFNPVPLMRVVEVIGGARTRSAVVERLAGIVRETGHAPVVAADTPGFLINHAGRGYGTEALRLVGEGVASFETVDRIMREQVRFTTGAFRLGPFELLDLTGLDVSQPVMESIYRQFYEEPRFSPSVLAAQRAAAGLYGRKSGEGFYDYRDAATERIAPSLARAAAAPRAPDADADAARRTAAPAPRDIAVQLAPSPSAQALRALLERLGARVVDDADALGDDGFVLIAPLGIDASGYCARHGLPASRTIAIDTLFDPGASGCARRVLMPTVATDARRRDAAAALFARDGVAVSMLRDSTGFVAQRIIAMIVSIGTEIAQQRIASPADIDLAVRLGLGYPLGPLAMGDELGPVRILEILGAVFETTGDPRYRPGGWLRRRAQLGLPLSLAD